MSAALTLPYVWATAEEPLRGGTESSSGGRSCFLQEEDGEPAASIPPRLDGGGPRAGDCAGGGHARNGVEPPDEEL